MARSRRKGKGTPNGKANAKNNSHGRHNARSNATPQSVKSHATTFSLADEAKWASSHRSSAFSADKKLRSLQIEFVSAGLLEGTLKVQETVVETATVPESSPDSSPTAATAMRKMAIRSPSPLATPSDSSSSEDEIVFKGRANMVSAQVSASSQTAPSSVTNKPTPPLPQKPLPKVVPKATATVNKKAAPPSSVPPHRRAKASTLKASGASAEESDHAASDEEDINAVEFLKRSGLESPWMSNTMPWESRSKPGVGWLPLDARPDMRRVFNGDADEADSKAAAEDDYMQNIREELLGAGSAGPTSFARRDLDLDAGDSDDHFVAADSEESDGDEDSQASRDSEDDDDDESSEDDDELTDAQLAKVLQKQEELGLGSDEVLLYGGDEIFDDSDVEELPVNRPDRPSKRRQMRIRGGKRGQKTFPSASLMADVLEADPYNGFDIMDTDRPSLRPMKKGRRGQMPPELSDSDLNEQLQSAWAADRAKKRLKKAEREDLRKQGLLGRKGKAPDLSKRYEDGISMNDVVEEIREWFFSEIQSLSLPPMQAPRRAVIHQMVSQLGVNSKSRGDGANRFTVLSKTSRTKVVEDDFFDGLIQQKRFRARFRETTERTFGKKSKRPAGAVGYKDGDTVGASAPELGPDNKGHALLQKMGWSKGMALGALDNKGILQPIAHTVKTGKAGLK